LICSVNYEEVTMKSVDLNKFSSGVENAHVNEYGIIDRALIGDDKNRTLFDWSPLAIIIINQEGILLDSNKKLFAWLGYKPEEVIGRNIFDLPFLTQGTRRTIRKMFDQRISGQQIPAYEVAFLHKNGETIWGEIHATLFRDEITGVVLDLVMIANITEKKKALDNLKESEEKYRSLFEGANDLIQSVDSNGKFIEVNPKWLNVLGYTNEEVKTLTLKDILREDKISQCMELFSKVCKGESVEHVETVFISKMGKEILVEGSANGIFKDGRFIATIGIFREITQINS